MGDRLCTFSGNREEMLMAYLYDEMPPATRTAFTSHLAACEMCRGELSGLQAVRINLEHWAPPELGTLGKVTPLETTPANRRQGVMSALFEAPAWMQAAAAILCVGVAAGAANVNVKYNADGLSVRTGWLSAPAPVAPPPAQRGDDANAPVSRAELTALADQLRSELRPVSATVSAPQDTMPQVRALISESERRQQTELALRLAGLAQDVRAQRASDLERVDRSLNAVQYRVNVESARSQQMFNTVNNAVRTSLVTTPTGARD